MARKLRVTAIHERDRGFIGNIGNNLLFDIPKACGSHKKIKEEETS